VSLPHFVIHFLQVSHLWEQILIVKYLGMLNARKKIQLHVIAASEDMGDIQNIILIVET